MPDLTGKRGELGKHTIKTNQYPNKHVCRSKNSKSTVTLIKVKKGR